MKLAADTDAAAEQVLLQLLRESTPARKMRMILEANRTARACIDRLKERHPGDSPGRLKRRLADLWLGPELAAKAYGPLPDHE